MKFKRLCLPQNTFYFQDQGVQELRGCFLQGLNQNCEILRDIAEEGAKVLVPKKRNLVSQVYDCIFSLALCHNVTPTLDDNQTKQFQASSPDEVALVKCVEELGLSLLSRDQERI